MYSLNPWQSNLYFNPNLGIISLPKVNVVQTFKFHSKCNSNPIEIQWSTEFQHITYHEFNIRYVEFAILWCTDSKPKCILKMFAKFFYISNIHWCNAFHVAPPDVIHAHQWIDTMLADRLNMILFHTLLHVRAFPKNNKTFLLSTRNRIKQ